MIDNDFCIVVCSSSYESAWSYVDEIEIRHAYTSAKNKIQYLLMEVLHRIIPKSQKIFFDKTNVNLEKTCVVFDAGATLDYLKWFKENNPKARTIFYYWNGIEKNKIQPEDIKKIGYEVWSFDPDNCKEYDLFYNGEFYCASWYRNINIMEPPRFDISFVGRDKNGRMQEIQELCNRFPQDLNCDLYFTANKWYKRFKKKEYSPYLTYEQVLERELQSKAVLDYSHVFQSSITLRVYDALYNKRKVITNNKEIVKDSIYKRNNIFIIGVDPFETLNEFINAPFERIPEDIMYEHSILGWKERFS